MASASTRAAPSHAPQAAAIEYEEGFDFPHFPEYAGPKYKWGATVPEESGSSPTQSWSVAFCHRPCGYHVRGPAKYWREEWTNEQNPRDDLDLPRYSEHDWPKMFATVNQRCLRIYSTDIGKSPQCVHKRTFPKEEVLYCVTWVYNADGSENWWIICAGQHRVVWIFDAVTKEPVRTLLAHGEAINDVQIHPRDPSLLITASKDESLRLWNMRTGAQIAMFAGLKGHHGEVVSADWDRFGNRFASCSIDNSIRIWGFATDKLITDAILQSHEAADSGVDHHGYYMDESGVRRKTEVVVSQEPTFVVRKIHKHYVDSIAWIGDALLSKSLHNMLYLWLPGADRLSLASETQDYTLLQEYPVQGADVWFIRFGMCTKKQTLAVGGRNGSVTVFYLKEFTPKPIVLKPAGKKLADDIYIRKCVFSDDSKVIIAVGDDAKVYQYDREDVAKIATPQKQRRRKKSTKTSSSEISPLEVDRAASTTPMRHVGDTNHSRSNGVRSSPRNKNKNNNALQRRDSASPPAEAAFTETEGPRNASQSNSNGNVSGPTVGNLLDDDVSTAVDSEELERRERPGRANVPVTPAAAADVETSDMEMDRPQSPKSPVRGQDDNEVEEVTVTPSRIAATPPRVSAIAPPPTRQTVSAIAPPAVQETEEGDNDINIDEDVVAVKEEMRTQHRDDDNDKEPPEVIEISD